MIGFNYQAREYIPGVDLTTLGNTFNTLEQGHKEAVKATNELQTVVANLDMNEAEDGFKQSLIDGIQQTIKDNTIYGNSAGALDDIILQSGKIATSQAVQGRLRSQTEFKQYQAKVDAMNIPEGMKQMYKEENQYHYEDGAKDKNGNVTAGKTWEATTNPVATVARADIAKQALSIAAKESGGIDSVTFLDANGKETRDPNKSATGEIYKSVNGSYERLSADKIRKAYNEAVKMIPGAEDSLRQDYKYALYNYNKTKGKTNPIIEGLTDDNGNIYSFDQWNNNQITNFAKLAAYNSVNTHTSYGEALKQRMTRTGINGSNDKIDPKTGLPISKDPSRSGVGVYTHGIKEEVSSTNPYLTAIGVQNNANKTGLALMKKAMGDDFGTMGSGNITKVLNSFIKSGKAQGPNTAMQYFMNTYGKNLTDEEKHRLISARQAFNTAANTTKKYNNLYVKNADALKFSENIESKDYTNDNIFGKNIINTSNGIWANNKAVEINLGEDMFSALLASYGKNANIETLTNLGLNVTKDDEDDGNYTIRFTADQRNLLPEIMGNVINAKKATTSWHGNPFEKIYESWTGRGGDHGFTVNYIRHDGSKNRIAGHAPGAINRSNTAETLGKIYNNGANKAAKGVKQFNADTEVKKGFKSYMAMDVQSVGELMVKMQAAEMGWTDTEIKNKSDAYNNAVDLAFANAAFDLGNVAVQNGTNYVDKPEQAAEIRDIIQKMYIDSNNRKNISRTLIKTQDASAGDGVAYSVAFVVPEEYETDNFKKGDKVRFRVKGIYEEGVDYDFTLNPAQMANEAIESARATGSNIENLGYNMYLGDTTLKNKGQRMFESNIFGATRIIDSDVARDMITDINRIDRVKNLYLSGVYMGDANKALLLDNSIKELAKEMSNKYKINASVIESSIKNYITNL